MKELERPWDVPGSPGHSTALPPSPQTHSLGPPPREHRALFLIPWPAEQQREAGHCLSLELQVWVGNEKRTVRGGRVPCLYSVQHHLALAHKPAVA